MPSKIFAVELTVAHSHILRLPESILGVYHSITYLHVSRILERIITVLTIAVDTDVRTMHEDIISMIGCHVSDIYILAVPQRLLCVGDSDSVKHHTIHLTEHLGSVYQRIAHLAVIRVPQRGSRTGLKIAMVNLETLHMPERILAFERATLGLDIAATLQGRFALIECHLHQPQVMGSE